MTDRVLTDDEVDAVEKRYYDLPRIHRKEFHGIDAIFPSHRLQATRIEDCAKLLDVCKDKRVLQAARIQELEKILVNALEARSRSSHD